MQNIIRKVQSDLSMVFDFNIIIPYVILLTFLESQSGKYFYSIE